MEEWFDLMDYKPTIKALKEKVPVMELDKLEKEFIQENARNFKLLNSIHNSLKFQASLKYKNGIYK